MRTYGIAKRLKVPMNKRKIGGSREPPILIFGWIWFRVPVHPKKRIIR